MRDTVAMKLEVITIPVGDVDRAKAFDLSKALKRAAAAHGEHEKRIGAADVNWPDWYAAWLVAEQAGETLPT